MNFQKNNSNIAVVCFFLASNGGNGAAEVTLSLYNSIQGEKRLFEINDQDISNKFFNFFFKIEKIFLIIFNIKKFFKNKNKNIIIIEGASWIGFTYIFFILCKIFLRQSILVYHSHNIEYDIRIKNNSSKIIIRLTKIFERFIYTNIDFATVVSNEDQKRIKKLYNKNSYLLENGVDIDRLKIKKPSFKLPKKYFMFIGNYWFKPNKEAIDKILNRYLPLIRKIQPNIYFIITGDNFPKEKLNDKKVKFYRNLKKDNLNYLIKNSEFLLFPLKKATGTKLKIIESLMIGGKIITTSNGMRGIRKMSKSVPSIFKNENELIKIIKNKTYIKNNSKNKVNYYRKIYNMNFILRNFFIKIGENDKVK